MLWTGEIRHSCIAESMGGKVEKKLLFTGFLKIGTDSGDDPSRLTGVLWKLSEVTSALQGHCLPQPLPMIT